MTKILFVLVVLAALAVYLSIRYKRQITIAIKLFKALRGAGAQGRGVSAEPVKSERLLQCSRCGTWVSESRAIKLRGQGVYCSPSCIENSATVA